MRLWFPYHSFYGVGISAGSSLLARYLGGAWIFLLGDQKVDWPTGRCLPPSIHDPLFSTPHCHIDASDESELDGGVLVSGGYDMEQSLQHMTPLADLVVTSHAKSHFLSRNEETLAAEDEGGLQRLKRSRSMHEFHQHMHVFDGKVGVLSFVLALSLA